jgi:hypothetical protein
LEQWPVLVVLPFLAFPGLPVLAAARWLRAGMRYQDFKRSVFSADELNELQDRPEYFGRIDRVIPAVAKGIRSDEVTDLRVQSGEFGPEGEALRRTTERRFGVVMGAIPIGLILGLVIAAALR